MITENNTKEKIITYQELLDLSDKKFELIKKEIDNTIQISKQVDPKYTTECFYFDLKSIKLNSKLKEYEYSKFHLLLKNQKLLKII